MRLLNFKKTIIAGTFGLVALLGTSEIANLNQEEIMKENVKELNNSVG